MVHKQEKIALNIRRMGNFTHSSDNQPTGSLQKMTVHSDAPPEGETPCDNGEFFIRRAMEQDSRQGCSLLFRQYYAPLCSHAARYVYSREIAEDVVAQVFCDLWERQLFRQITFSYRAFLFKTVRNRCIDHLRVELGRKSIHNLGDVRLESSLSQSPEAQMAFNELSQLIQQAVETMPPQCKRVFLMSRFEGKRIAEIAESLQLSPRTAETHLTRALSLLRTLLRNQGVLLILVSVFFSSLDFLAHRYNG